MKTKERYIIDENGEKISVILDIAEFRELLEDLEELESLRAFDAAKKDAGEVVAFEQAVSEIERKRS